MATLKPHIPNFFTCLNLFSGCLSIVYATGEDLKLAGIFIIIAALFDFADGWLARLLNGYSEFGKQLDSLADVVSFGVAPSFIVYKLLQFALVDSAPESNFNIVEPGFIQTMVLGSSFLIAIFAALRLARFNIDTTQTESFRGLPTPAAALLIAALAFVVTDDQHNLPMESFILKLWFLLILIAAVCGLMVSGIRMFSMKFKHYGIKDNVVRYLFLLFSIILLILFRLPGFFPVILLYILLSFVYPLFRPSSATP
ncbi:MAG: CDP-diacylglycerol--serine O-phosphatidyltransferase [Bacteroidales bacterium]|nr:CDP-diacylglycerol--serine O-phosphatidyltransferase [Bacteroidales bacterium]